MTYQYDAIGNITQRVDVVQGNLTENFTYDNLNRLRLASGVMGQPIVNRSFEYDIPGNITYKSDVGNYTYPTVGQARPHAVSSITGTVEGLANPKYDYDANGSLTQVRSATGTPCLPTAAPSPAPGERCLTYMSFNMPATSTAQNFLQPGTSVTYTYTYNADHERTKLITTTTLGTDTTIYLHPAGKGQLLYEKETKVSGLVENRNYITAGGMLVGVYISRSDSTTDTRYFHKDHLGSLAVITNASGTVVERLAYEAFGKRRGADGADDPNNMLYGITTDRGFTGHEHLDEMALIHMNGRIYDPALARFMTPDPFIQSPDNLQSYNRYTYGWNNPLSGVDPSGYGWLSDFFSDPIGTLTGTIEKALDNPQMIVAGALAAWTGGMIANGLISSATSGFIAGANGLSTAFVTLGGEAGVLSAWGAAVSGAGAGFAGGFLASGGDLGFALKSGLAVGLTAGLGQFGLESAGMPGSIAGRGFGSGLGAQALGGNFADGIKNGLLGAVRSEAFMYTMLETDKLAMKYWGGRGGMNYDELGRPWTYGNRGCGNTGDACPSLLGFMLMPVEFSGTDPGKDSWHRRLPLIGRGLGEIPIVGSYLNSVSKVHDWMNQALTGVYDSNGGSQNFGLLKNTAIDAVSTMGMIPAASFTSRALFQNPLGVRR